jgi:hypothetical protein
MNQNPWYLERMGEYERDRIRDEMKQIRLEEEAMKAGHIEENKTTAHVYHPRLLTRIVPIFVKWMVSIGR